MTQPEKTTEQLLQELEARRQKYTAFEAAERTAALGRISQYLQAEMTGRLQAEEALRESENRYRHLVEHSLGLICTHDLDGVLLSINPAAARALGYRPTDGVGKKLSDFLVPEVRHLFADYLERMRQQTADSGLMRLMTKSGAERVWVYHNVRYEEAGKPPYVLGHAQDITERVRMEEELRQAHAELESRVAERTAQLRRINERLHAEIAERQRTEEALREQTHYCELLLAVSQDGVCIVDEDSTLRTVNPAFAAILGSTPQELQGLPWQELLVGQAAPQECARRLQTVMRTGAARFETQYRRRDGEVIDLEVSVHATEVGETQCFLGFLRDMTARKRLEAQLQQAHPAAPRDASGGAVAHELNNLFEAVLGYTDLALSDLPPSSPTVRHLRAVLTAGKRAKALVQQNHAHR